MKLDQSTFDEFEEVYNAVTDMDNRKQVHEPMSKYERMDIAFRLMDFEMRRTAIASGRLASMMNVKKNRWKIKS